MLDVRSKQILKYIVSECGGGTYRVISINELQECMPKKFKADSQIIFQCMTYLEEGNYISIKYKDKNMYCVSPLPFARQMLEQESSESKKAKQMLKIGGILYILVFIFAFLGSFLAIMFYGFLF